MCVWGWRQRAAASDSSARCGQSWRFRGRSKLQPLGDRRGSATRGSKLQPLGDGRPLSCASCSHGARSDSLVVLATLRPQLVFGPLPFLPVLPRLVCRVVRDKADTVAIDPEQVGVVRLRREQGRSNSRSICNEGACACNECAEGCSDALGNAGVRRHSLTPRGGHRLSTNEYRFHECVLGKNTRDGSAGSDSFDWLQRYRHTRVASFTHGSGTQSMTPAGSQHPTLRVARHLDSRSGFCEEVGTHLEGAVGQGGDSTQEALSRRVGCCCLEEACRTGWVPSKP